MLHNSNLSRVYIADNDKTYCDIFVNCPIFLSSFNECVFSRQILIKVPNMTCHGNLFGGSRAHQRG